MQCYVVLCLSSINIRCNGNWNSGVGVGVGVGVGWGASSWSLVSGMFVVVREEAAISN